MPASGSNSWLSDQSIDCGLPHRPPTASTAVWKHLLQNTTFTEGPKSLRDVSIIAPPMAPLDKNATSMRVLLHDTQANFEKFSIQVEKLFETIQGTKNELKTMQTLFQRDRETLTGDIVDLVNRSQREIQKSIGTPLQADAFENLWKTINFRLDGLDQRLEALNAFNQTHSQALQTQMHTVQLILDKQGSILSAVAPIVPFLQGLPPLIEALRIVLTEKLRELSDSLKHFPPSPVTSIKRKRSLIEHGATSTPRSSEKTIKSPRLSDKRLRVMDLSDGELSTNCTSLVTNSGQRRSTPLLHTSSSSPLPPVPVSTETLPSTTSTILPQTSTAQNLTTPRQQRKGFAVPSFPPPTSRRHLIAAGLTGSGVDHGPSSVPSSTPLLAVPMGLSALRSRTDVPAPVTVPTPQRQSGFFGLSPTATRAPRMLQVHASIDARSRSNSVVSTAERQTASTAMGNPRDHVNKKGQSERPMNVEQNLMQIRAAQDGEKPTTSKLTTKEVSPFIGRITRSSTRAVTPLVLPPPPRPVTKTTKLTATLAPPSLPQPSLKEEKETVVPMKNRTPLAALKGKNISRPPLPETSKERRSPLKEGRRFISLIDSDDEEENQ